MADRLRGRAGKAQRARRMDRTHWLCEMCKALGKTRPAKFVDHIIPLAHGGPDTDDNTRNLCDDCNDTVTREQFGHKARKTIGLDGWPR